MAWPAMAAPAHFGGCRRTRTLDTLEPENRCGSRQALLGRAARRLLLAGLVFDDGVDLLLHRFQIEGSRILHRRIVDGSLRKLSDLLLDQHEPPELPGIEIIHIAAAEIVQALRVNGGRA